MKMLNFIAIADAHLAENRLDEAQRYCNHALEVAEHMSEDHHLLGMMYQVYGKVAFAKAKEASGEEARSLLQEAQDIYKKAEEHLVRTQATTHLAELYGQRARCARP